LLLPVTLAASGVDDPRDADITGANTFSPAFTPDAVGQYDLGLVVNDGADDSAPDTVLITASLLPTLSIDDV